MRKKKQMKTLHWSLLCGFFLLILNRCVFVGSCKCRACRGQCARPRLSSASRCGLAIGAPVSEDAARLGFSRVCPASPATGWPEVASRTHGCLFGLQYALDSGLSHDRPGGPSPAGGGSLGRRVSRPGPCGNKRVLPEASAHFLTFLDLLGRWWTPSPFTFV